MMLEELKGKLFRRNVYGLSIWSDRIKEIVYRYNLKSVNPSTYTIEINVIGNLSNQWYGINEILLISEEPSHQLENLVMEKRERHEKIRNNIHKGDKEI